MTLESIRSRLEKLEHIHDGGWDYSVTYYVGYGEDEDAIRESALAEYRAEHETKPDDEVLLVRVAFVDPTDPPEWRYQRCGLALH